MGKIDKEIFVCIDCETTGLDSVQDRVIEVAVAQFNVEGILAEFETLIDPECEIPEGSIKIHHITPDMVRGKPKIGEVLPRLIELIGNHIIIGHGVSFDIDLIVQAAQRGNVPCNLKNNRFMDTLRLARSYGESPVNSLEQLRQHFNIMPEGAHRAMSDVIVNIGVFKRLIQKYKTVEELFEILSKPVSMKIMPLGPHKGRPLKEVPLPYLLWAAQKDFDQDLLYSIRSEINRRKKGNLFSQASNPFSGL